MTTTDRAPEIRPPAEASRTTTLHDVAHPFPTTWLRLSIAIAVLSAIGNVVSLLAIDRFYGNETEVFVNQAIAQDLVNLFVIAPLTLVLAMRALSGSVSAYLLWLGVLGFTVYNYVIYAFSIQFGPLFLLWVAVLGGAIYALIGGASALDAQSLANAMGFRRQRLAAGVLMFTAASFLLMWLSEIVPAQLEGDTPRGVSDMGLPTNPVHVLDLAFYLPAAALAGWWLWQRHPVGYVAAPAVLTFLALTGVPILTTVFVAATRDQDAAWQLLAPIGVLTVVTAALAWTTSRLPRPRAT